MLDHIVTESIREHFPRQRRDRYARRLALENVAEVFEVAVAAPDTAVAELEGGDVCPAKDFVVGVHAAAHAVGAGVFDLEEVVVISLGYFLRCGKRRLGGREERPGRRGQVCLAGERSVWFER